MYFPEIEFELGIKEADFWPFKYFSNKIASFFKHFNCDVKCSD